MSIQKIIDYAMHTPHNTNPAIFKQVIKDNISWNDLKDKPFYEEKCVLFEGKVEFEQRKRIDFDNPIDLQIGNIYTVIIDGAERQFECEYDPTTYAPYLVFSFRGLILDIFSTHIECMSVPNEMVGSHILEIVDAAKSFTKTLDHKYTADVIVHVFKDWNNSTGSTEPGTKQIQVIRGSYAEILEKLENGQFVTGFMTEKNINSIDVSGTDWYRSESIQGVNYYYNDNFSHIEVRGFDMCITFNADGTVESW